MVEQELRSRVVSIMEEWLGRNEANGGHKAIIDLYNTQSPLPRGYRVQYTDEWCATAVSAAFLMAGLADIGFQECSCSRMLELYRTAGRWMEDDGYAPAPGDVILYDWQDSGVRDNTGAPDHVGIVESCDGSTVRTIEGNSDDACRRSAYGVGSPFIMGYGACSF